MSTGMLEESPGVRSSKRTMGVAMIAAGGAVLVACAVCALVRPEPMANATLAVDAGKALLLIGASLLGVTVVEAFAK